MDKFCDYQTDDGEMGCARSIYEMMAHKDLNLPFPKCSFNIDEIKIDSDGKYYISHSGKKLFGECVDFCIKMNEPEMKKSLDELLSRAKKA